nr:MAG TPA: hypothetical protein [Caudoviricetes sp.]
MIEELHALQPRRRPDLPRAACLVSGAERAACPASGRVCLTLRGLFCIWHGLRCCLSCAAVPGALGAGVSTGGVYSRRPAPPGQSLNHRKNKKRPTPPLQNGIHLIVQVSKNSKKYKKTPFGA